MQQRITGSIVRWPAVRAVAPWLAAALLALWPGAAMALAAPPPGLQSFDGQAWRRMTVRPGGQPARPSPPRAGRKRCISIDGVAAAQLFGDRAIELTMRGGQRYRMYLAQECPALSFYQGFYYQQKQAGQLCAGRDAIGARSGGECAIASIMPVPPEKRRRR